MTQIVREILFLLLLVRIIKLLSCMEIYDIPETATTQQESNAEGPTDLQPFAQTKEHHKLQELKAAHIDFNHVSYSSTTE